MTLIPATSLPCETCGHDVVLCSVEYEAMRLLRQEAMIEVVRLADILRDLRVIRDDAEAWSEDDTAGYDGAIGIIGRLLDFPASAWVEQRAARTEGA